MPPTWWVLTDPDEAGTTASPVTAQTRRWMWPAAAAGLVLVIVAVGALAWLQPWQEAEQVIAEAIALDPQRIAVLPFDNISANDDDACFAEGMTEELIGQLSKIGQLSVIARTSVLRYQDTEKGIDEIGRELGVGTILEGSVRKAGDEVRITAQLIDVASQAHLWSEKYDRPFEGIFAIQSDIAEQVADALQITLLASEQTQIEDRGTDSIEAYDLYLQGLYFYNQSTTEGTRKARSYFEQAIEKDPRFAKAYAMLSNVYGRALWQDYTSPEESMAKMREAVDKALELDDSLAEAHAMLGDIQINFEWDWDGAERSLRRAIELNPSYAEARVFLGHMLLTAIRRQHDEAIIELQTAVELDPWTAQPQNALGWGYYHAERYAEALAQFRKAQEMFPESPFIYVGVAQPLAMQDRFDQAVVEMERGAEVAPDNTWISSFLAWTYGVAGRVDEARAVIEGLEAGAEERPVPPMAMAYANVGMGDVDRTLYWLEKAYDERGTGLIFMQGPDFRQVLDDEPRYQALRRKLKLGPEDWS